jgi:hypothetical protein
MVNSHFEVIIRYPIRVEKREWALLRRESELKNSRAPNWDWENSQS